MKQNQGNRKRFILFFGGIIIIIACSAPLLAAPSSTPTISTTPIITKQPTVTLSQNQQDIETLKDKIATKVAQLRQISKSIVSGYIQKIEDKTILIKTSQEKVYKIMIDETLSKYYNIKNTQLSELKFSDLKKNDYIITAGSPIEENITANSIYVDQEYLVLTGKITDTDQTNSTIEVLTSEKDQYTLTIDTKSKLSIFETTNNKIEKIKIGKIKIGDTVHFVILKNSSKTGPTVLRLLIIPQEYFEKKV